MIALNAPVFDVVECATEEAWLAERDRGIGASEVAVLLGLSDWASPYSLWAQKTGKIPKGESDAEFLEWGRFAEDGIAKRYAYRTGRALRDLGRFTILRSKSHPFLFATLDRIIDSVPVRDDGLYPFQSFMIGPAPCEIKQATLFGHHAWDEGPPLKVQCQLQTQLAVSGWLWGSIAATMPSGKFDAIDCERSDDFIELVVNTCGEFWRCVETDTPPEIDGSDWTAKAIRKLHPQDSGATVHLSEQALSWASELEDAKAQIKEMEEYADERKNKLIAAIGDATFGKLPNGEQWSYKTQTRKEHIVRASSSRVLRKVGGK